MNDVMKALRRARISWLNLIGVYLMFRQWPVDHLSPTLTGMTFVIGLLLYMTDTDRTPKRKRRRDDRH